MLMLIWSVVALLCAVLWLRWRYSYFKIRGVKNPPIVPLFGNLYKPLTKSQHISGVFQDLYDRYSDERFIGTFELTAPVLLVRDPELLRQIGVKDFDHFVNHRSFGNDNDPFFSKSLFGLKDQKWRDMRSMLSPAFTGSKLRNMVPLIMDCNKVLIKHLQEDIEQSTGKAIDIDTHDLLTRYTNDVIATCVFGLQSDSFAERDNTIFKMGSKLTTFNFIQIIKIFIVSAIPADLQKAFDIRLFPKEAINFFKRVVLDTMKIRDENNTFRPDMIQILLEAKKGTLNHEKINDNKDAGFATVEESTVGKSAIKRGWSDDDLVAQATLFFFAGFDTVSTCMKFLLLELAINTDVQDKLRNEIEEHHNNNQGKVTYENLNDMKYLDMVISETLRKWPPTINTDRACTKQYNLGKPNEKAEKDFIVDKGMVINIPVHSIHRDPAYYPNPDKFDPERFSDENKHNINQFTYMPFGIGPRNCIGSRFALSEVKAMTYEIIRHFELSPAPQTLLPPRYDRKQFIARLEGGHWLRFKKISK